MNREQPSAEQLMRQRIAEDDAEQCGASLHDDRSSGVFCLAKPHDADVVHVSLLDAPELGVEQQLIQWNNTAKTQDVGNDHAAG